MSPQEVSALAASVSAGAAVLALAATLVIGVLTVRAAWNRPAWTLDRTNQHRQHVYFYVLLNSGNAAAYDVRIDDPDPAGDGSKPPRPVRPPVERYDCGQRLVVVPQFPHGPVQEIRVRFRERPRARERTWRTEVVKDIPHG